MSKKIYGKAIKTGWILALLGCVGGVAGVMLADATKESGFFALMAFGALLVITGLVTVGVYAGMERGVRRAFGDREPLLRFTMSARDYVVFAKAEAEEIRSANKASLLIAVVFCGAVALVGPFVVKHDGYIMFYIGVGLAAFLTLAAWIITKYRVYKLRSGDKEVILTAGAAYVGNQFHTWNTPVTFLSEATYFPPGALDGCRTAAIRIAYSALSGTLVTPYSFVIVVPSALEQQAASAVSALQSQLKAAPKG